MKQYEIRSADLKNVEMALTGMCDTLQSAISKYQRALSDVPNSVLVEHEFETDAEADRARLVFIEKNGIYGGLILINGQWLNRLGEPVSFLQFIDAARNAPKPKVTVIATLEGAA